MPAHPDMSAQWDLRRPEDAGSGPTGAETRDSMKPKIFQIRMRRKNTYVQSIDCG